MTDKGVDPGNLPFALVYEELETCDSGRFSGKFSAHLDDSGKKDIQQGPLETSLGEALTWAHSVAPVVLVRIGAESEMYSAGSTYAGQGHPVWPASGLHVVARPVGTPADGQLQTRPWKVTGRVISPSAVSARERAEFAALLRNPERAFSARAWGEASVLQFECLVEDRGVVDALATVRAATESALVEILGAELAEKAGLEQLGVDMTF